MSFRFKLFGAIMVVVAASTVIALFLAERNADAELTRNVERQFQDAFRALQDARQFRLASLTQRCRLLAKSVRIRAALEESSSGDLYANAEIELRAVLTGEAEVAGTASARFFRFLDAQGVVIPPGKPGVAGAAEGLEAKLGASGAPDRQDIAYVRVGGAEGRSELTEVIATPIVATDIREVIGAIVLGFPPPQLPALAEVEGLRNGIWADGELFLPALSAGALAEVAAVLRRPAVGPDPIPISLDGSRYLLLRQRLNPDSRFAGADEVCLFPLASALARQRQLRWQILGAGVLLLTAGLAASHFISARLSAPVEQLAVDSAVNQAQREQAENALELTHQELVERNAELQSTLAELKATQAQVIQQERLSALGQMASGIAHDFNNSLVPILGYTQLLQLNPKALEDTERAKKYLGVIYTAAQDAASVVSRLQHFHQPRNPQESLAAVDLDRLAEQAILLTQPRWKNQARSRGATIEIQPELGNVPPIAGDESALREALVNLIFNAVDAMPDGGRITVRTRRATDCGVIEVADTGTGMTEEVRRRCLDPFFSTKGKRGTGLGLAMVNTIAERHGGSLQIDSELGRGTTFALTLPLHASGAVGATVADARPGGRAVRVLVVDDEPSVRELLADILTDEGHAVETAPLAEEALRRLEVGAFDLLVTDMSMPSMSGAQLAAASKQRWPEIPVILLSGFGDSLDQNDFPGVDLLLAKPLDLLALRRSIAQAFPAA